MKRMHVHVAVADLKQSIGLAAVIALTKSLGKELVDTAIRVNCVTPAGAHFSMAAPARCLSRIGLSTPTRRWATTSTFDIMKSELTLGRAEALRRAMLGYIDDRPILAMPILRTGRRSSWWAKVQPGGDSPLARGLRGTAQCETKHSAAARRKAVWGLMREARCDEARRQVCADATLLRSQRRGQD